jgi:PPOX class probable F420-dependent enzyme
MTARAPATGARLHAYVAARAETQVPRISGRYLSITSYRRDGTGVATPVWFVTEDDQLLVLTAVGSGKVQRIRRNPLVTVAACFARGRLHGRPIAGRAQLLPSTEVERVKRLMGRKYRIDLLFIRPIRALQSLLHPERRDETTTVVSVTPSQS